MALHFAFFDESGTAASSPFLCVAGYLFEKDAALELSDKWQEFFSKDGEFRVEYFHMTDCNVAKGVFAHLSDEECDRAARKAIELIKQYAKHGIALSIEKSAFHLIPPSGGSLWGKSPYAMLSNQVGFAIRDWVPTGDRVSYFFEAGAHGQNDALVAMSQFLCAPETKDIFRHGSHSFLAKPEAPLLQCADMLAWQWHKHCNRSAAGNHKLRGDFKSLLSVPTVKHHYGRDELIATRRFLGLPISD